MRPSAAGIGKSVSTTATTKRSGPRLIPKRPREDSDSDSVCDSTNEEDNQADMEKMDVESTATQYVTATQALGETSDAPGYLEADLPPPLTPEHAALRADLQIITEVAMTNLYNRITIDIMKSVDDNATALKKTTNQLHSQITSLTARVAQLQQQVLACQPPKPVPTMAPVAAPAKKVLKLKLGKKNPGQDGAAVATSADITPPAPSTTPQTPSTNARRWETAPPRAKAPVPKLIPTKYPQAEREVTCFFKDSSTTGMTTQPEKTYAERQGMADIALRRMNSAFVDYKDISVPPFIRARITIRGAIVFTTGNDQSNVIYEDYISIMTHALEYYGECERVEIGKRFSQFLLHGVPTNLSISDISDSISANYPQLIQGQTPRWLTPPERREHKACSTIVMTLAGNVKKETIGRQNLIVCNRQCEVDDYIAYGRSTQCRKCQTYGHPAALCRNDSCCAVCAGPHETREHPCTLPTCKKGPACTHPPIRCVNCNAPHKASDPNCPERIKLRTLNKATNATNLGDAPMAGAAN
jgi:hypothetical protein